MEGVARHFDRYSALVPQADYHSRCCLILKAREPARILTAIPADYRLSALRYDLSELRAKGLVEKIPHSRRYRLSPHGYRICLLFLKLFARVYAPLTAGLLRPL